MTARLGILLSGSGTTYANLVEAIKAGRLDAEIAVVISSRADAYGLERAKAFGHPSRVAKKSDDVTAALLAARVDWVAFCGWMRFYDPPAELRGRVVNIHPSLLPAFGGKGMYGLHVHEAVLAADATTTGCTVHLVAGAYDSGPILAQSRVPVLPGDTVDSLQQRVQAAERELYPRVIADLIAGKILS
jgi:phosphoribosylglycinamide formyltransferase 1